MTQKKGKVFNFKDQMRIGDIGEAEFIKIYEKLEPKKSIKNRKIDFTLNNGKTIELKTDSYSMEKTPNFFMEKETILPDERVILGGPWRSKDHKVDYFVYYYMNDKVFFKVYLKDGVFPSPVTLREMPTIMIETQFVDSRERPTRGSFVWLWGQFPPPANPMAVQEAVFEGDGLSATINGPEREDKNAKLCWSTQLVADAMGRLTFRAGQGLAECSTSLHAPERDDRDQEPAGAWASP